MNSETQTAPAGPGRHRVLWTSLAVLGGLLVLIPVALYLVLFIGFESADKASPTVGDAFTAARHYYQAVQQRDYTTAYSYIAPQATMTVNGQTSIIDSATTLAAIAQTSDQKDGPITSFTPTDGSFEQGKLIVDMIMRVTRSAGSYDVHIQVGLSNGKWKILHTDSL